MSLAIIYGLTVILFLGLVLSLGFQPKTLVRLNGFILFFAGVSGILLYGYGYSVLYDSALQSVIRTLFSVFCMFLGRNEISAISSAPALQSPFMQFYIYTTHLLALYCTASAVVAAVGTRLIRTLRLLLFKRKDLNLIYGADADTIHFAQQLHDEGRGEIVFVDGGNGGALEADILKMGSLLFTDTDAVTPTEAFFKKIGMHPSGRHLNVYCLDRNPAANFSYAKAMSALLKEKGYRPAQTSLTAVLNKETAGAVLQAGKDGSGGGFGTVLAVERADILSRLMIRQSAPYETMTFDENGLATHDFLALVIGFGLTGQAVLRRLIANGQFAGSQSRIYLAAKDYSAKAGSFFYRYPGLKDHDSISVIEDDARSVEFYTFLEEYGRELDYIAICTGSDKENTEIAYELRDFLAGYEVLPAIMLCSENGVRRLEAGGLSAVKELYSTEVLCGAELDRMAAVINHQYHLSEGNTAEEDWETCDYFSRLSCRASAEYLDAFLKAAGTDREAVLKGAWNVDGELLENLSRMEHLRWCAFHETAGYQVMPEEVYAAREAQYIDDIETKGTSAVRIGKDADSHLHACLIPWEDLDALSARESAVTGRDVDYKEMDRDNVRMIPAMIRAAKEGETA